MKIIVGLGNVGEKYSRTRHNCGFLVIDRLAEKLSREGLQIDWKEEKKFKAFVANIEIKNTKILLVKPVTLMNLSGESVLEILNFYKLQAASLIIAYDDIDLPLGKIRIRDKGSAGTHNGMRSIIQMLGTDHFKRIRIGIESRGETSAKQQDLSSFVLANFSKEEIPTLNQAIDLAAEELKKEIWTKLA